jgi:hypothetical protein
MPLNTATGNGTICEMTQAALHKYLVLRDGLCLSGSERVEFLHAGSMRGEEA